MTVQNIVQYYDYIDEKSFPTCNHKLVGLHGGVGVALTWVLRYWYNSVIDGY